MWYPAYVGIDQHAAWLVVFVALADGWSEPEDWGRFENSVKGVKKLLKRFGGEVVALCYEAGPCGFGLHRTLEAAGHDCLVVSPASVAVESGRRRKTDRRDAGLLAKRLRSGELTGITVPDEEREAMRSLTRCRSDAKDAQRRARQQLQSFLLRLGVGYTLTKNPGRRRTTPGWPISGVFRCTPELSWIRRSTNWFCRTMWTPRRARRRGSSRLKRS